MLEKSYVLIAVWANMKAGMSGEGGVNTAQ